MPTYDAIVVGARCAGSGTALNLARRGASVLLLDRAPTLGDTLSTHALLRAGVLQLVRWGVLDRVIDAGTPAIRRSTYHLADGDIPITIKPAAGVDAFYAPRRKVLDGILLDAAVEAGAEVRLGTRMLDVVRRDGRVVGVDVRDADGRTTTFESRIVVGADGRDSTVAAAVGARAERVATASSAIVYGYVAGLTLDGYQWWFRGRHSAGAVPTNHDQTCIFAGSAPDDVAGGAPADVLRRGLARTAPELLGLIDDAGPGAITGVRSFSGAPGYLRRPWGPGWALVGDAGYMKDPITAHGISDALRDAELLARAIIAAGGDPALQAVELASFHELRDSLSVPLFDVAEQLAAHRWTDDDVRELLLQTSSATTSEVDALLDLDIGVA